MAPAGFPLPRSMLPKLDEHPDMHKTAKHMMRRLRKYTVREFEKLAYARSGVVDTTQWKALSKAQAYMNGQRDGQVKVYSEREWGATSTDLASMLQASNMDDESTLAALTPTAVLVNGQAQDKLENVMYALGGAHTQTGLALFASVMYGDVADCGVLHAVERDEEAEETSCRFLGYKYVVKRRVTSSAKFMHYRDVVYLESTGYTHSSTGERLGFHIQHSVDVPGFPDLHDRNSSRARQSLRYIFRQKTEKIVEIYMLGNLDLAGVFNVGGVGVGGSTSAASGDLFSMSKLQQCAETRRLAVMARHHLQSTQSSSSRHNTECHLCHRTKRFFSGAMLAECAVCGQLVCSKCRNDRKLFVLDANTNDLLGRLDRVQTCRPCVLAANVVCAATPMHMSVSQQVSKNQDDGKTRNGQRFSSSSRSRTSSVDERSVASNEVESNSHRQGVYTFSEANNKEFQERRRQPRHGLQKREPFPSKTSVSIAEARDRSVTSLSNLSVSLDDSNWGRGCRRRETDDQHGCDRHRNRTDPEEVLRRQEHNSARTDQPIIQNNSRCNKAGVAYRTNHQQHFSRTTKMDHGDLPRHDVANLYTNSYSSQCSTISVASRRSPRPDRGFQRSVSVPMVSGNSRRSNLMMQMLELNLKAESTYNATQRNGAFLKHQIQTHQW